VDPAAASRIHPNDPVRIVRALEVALGSGRRLSEWQAAHRFATPALDAVVIGLAVPTAELDRRIAQRATAMVDGGWLDEVGALLARNLPPDAPAWRTLGYAEMRQVVCGEATLDDAIAATVLATRRFAKRQRTWFRREAGIVWRDGKADEARILADARSFLDRPRIANPGSGG
jgi:tRNA dimethylallyltransferase